MLLIKKIQIAQKMIVRVSLFVLSCFLFYKCEKRSSQKFCYEPSTESIIVFNEDEITVYREGFPDKYKFSCDEKNCKNLDSIWANKFDFNPLRFVKNGNILKTYYLGKEVKTSFEISESEIKEMNIEIWKKTTKRKTKEVLVENNMDIKSFYFLLTNNSMDFYRGKSSEDMSYKIKFMENNNVIYSDSLTSLPNYINRTLFKD